MTYAQLVSLINTNLTRVGNNRVSASEIKEVSLALLDFAAAIDNTDAIPTWTAALIFQTDGTDAGKYCTHPDTDGKKRIWETKTDDNINQEPPTDPNITENTNWEEISASAGSAIHEWAAGVYSAGLVIVYHNHSSDGRGLYILIEPIRPFNSTNIETEITAGSWDRLNIENLQKTLARGNSAGAQRIIDLGDPVDPQDADTKAAREAAITALKGGVPAGGDTLNKLYDLIVGIGAFAGNHDASAGALPSTGTGEGGAINKGDYWIITSGGIIAGIDGADTLQANDVLYSKLADANLPAHFFGVNSNVDQATEAVAGVLLLQDQAGAEDAATNATIGNIDHAKAISGRALRWFWDKVKTLAVDITGQWSFLDPILSGTTYLGKTTDTGTDRTITPQGTEANIDIFINPKGATGRVKSDSLVGVGEAAARVRADGAVEREEIIELKTWNVTTVALSKATLNSTYPSATRGVQVICASISGGGKIYEKIDDVSNDWVSINITAVV